jgi:hypothetical protein
LGTGVVTVLGIDVVVSIGRTVGAVVLRIMFVGRFGMGVVTVRPTVVGVNVVKLKAAFFW